MTKRIFAAVLLLCLFVSTASAQSAATVFGWPANKTSPTADLTAKSITLSDKVKAAFAEITGNIYASGTLVVPTIKAATSAGLEIKGSGDATALTIGAGGGTAVSTADGLNVGGILKTATGTAAAPAYSFASDPNTGVYSPAADTIGFGEGGAESMRITSGGNVLIATSTDDGANKLQVNGTAKATSLYALGGNGNQLHLDNGGERYTQINFLNSGVQKSAIYYDNTNTALSFYAGGQERMAVKDNGFVNIVNITEYADNAAAKAAGRANGDLYHTAGVLKIVIP